MSILLCLYGEREQTFYMDQLEGFVVKGKVLTIINGLLAVIGDCNQQKKKEMNNRP